MNKKQIKITVLEGTVVFSTVEPKAEIARLNTGSLNYYTARALRVHGAKQICSEVVAEATTIEETIAGIKRAVDALKAGNWPAPK